MKSCRKCNIDLVVSKNISPAMLRNQDYICHPCHRQYNKWIGKIKGVYEIYDGELSLYVGESKQINRRISDHKYGIKNPESYLQGPLWEKLQQHPNLEFRILEECDNHKEREGYWIEKLDPKYNMY